MIHNIVFEFGSAAAWGYAHGKLFPFLGFSEWSADTFTPNYSGNKNIFLDVAVILPGQHKYVVDAAQTLGFSCNDYANEVSKNVEARVCEEDALYLPAVFLGILKRPSNMLFQITKWC